MAIPITDPYRRQQPDVMGAVRVGLDAQLARERMMIEQAAAERRAQQEERNRERQHQQQMAQYGLQEMKFNYDMAQRSPGGLKYAETMAQIGQADAATAENQAQAGYWQKRTENPQAFMSPGAAARPRIVPLTSRQIEANANAAALGQPPPYQPQIIAPPAAGTYGDPYANANVSDPNDPALADLQASLAAGMNGGPMPGETAASPPAYDVTDDLPAAGGAPTGTLLDPAAPAGPGPTGTGPLPMDPASVQRRQAMEYTRIKEQAAVSAALNKQKQDAQDAQAENENDTVAKAQLDQANKELSKLFAPAPKAEVVNDAPPVRLDPSKNVGGQTTVLSPAAGQMDQHQPQAPPPPERPGIGILPNNTTDSDQRKAAQFWDDGKAQAFRLAGLDKATDEELQAIVSGGNPDESGEMNFPPFRDGMTYAQKLAAQIKDKFKSPPWSDSEKAKGRSGEVDPEEFIREAANDELNRRKVVAPKTSGVTYRKTKSPDAPK